MQQTLAVPARAAVVVASVLFEDFHLLFLKNPKGLSTDCHLCHARGRKLLPFQLQHIMILKTLFNAQLLPFNGTILLSARFKNCVHWSILLLKISCYSIKMPIISQADVFFPRLFIDQSLDGGRVLALSAEHIHYLKHVLRLKCDDTIAVFNGRDGLWQATLERERKTLCARLTFCLEAQPASRPPFTLFFCLIKRQNWLLEKATELGISAFQPLVSQRCKLTTFCLDRHRKILQEASEQCHRLDLPALLPVQSLLSCHKSLSPQQMFGVLDCETQAGPWPKGLSGVFVGPESGWSDEERRTLLAQSHLVPIGLGSLVLRAETAGIMACSLALSQTFDGATP